MSAIESSGAHAPIVTVYLNQRLVFDLMAMLSGGLAMSSNVSTNSLSSAGSSYGAEGEAGLSTLLTKLFKLDIKASMSRSSEKKDSHNKEEERTHTPSSIFYELRKELIDREFVLSSDDERIGPGRLVEFSGRLSRNPLVETMNRLVKVIDIALKVGGLDAKHRGNERRELEGIKRMMLEFQQAILSGGTVDLFSESTTLGSKALITIEQRYLNDPDMADLVEGELTVIGKVISHVKAGSGSVDLLRKTAMSTFPESVVDNLFDHLSSVTEEHDFNIPRNFRVIEGPVVHILPLAIYV